MHLRKLVALAAVLMTATLAACSSNTITGPATAKSAQPAHYESGDGLGSLGGGG